MKKLFSFLRKHEGKKQKSLEAYKQDMLINVGKEQFKSLMKKHLDIPVLFL